MVKKTATKGQKGLKMLLSYASSTHTRNFRSFGNSYLRSDFLSFCKSPPKKCPKIAKMGKKRRRKKLQTILTLKYPQSY